MYSMSSSILQNSKSSTALPVLTTQLELDISNIHAISHQLTQDIGALLGSSKELDLIPVTQRVATIANVARYSATWLPITNSARDKLTADATTLVTLAETVINLKRDGKPVISPARNLLSFLLELCALITRAVSYHDQNPTPVPKQTTVLSRISETPPPVEHVDPNDVAGLVKKNLNLYQPVYALLEFNFTDAQDTTSRVKRFVNQVQAIQNAMAELALAVDVNTGNLIIENARDLMNSAMELIRVVRITNSANDYNFRNVIQQIKNNLNASINALNSVQTVKQPSKLNLGYIIRDVAAYTQRVASMITSGRFDEAIYVSDMKLIVNTSRSALSLLVVPSEQQQILDALRVVLQTSIAFKEQRSEYAKGPLLSAFTTLMNSLVNVSS